MRGCQLNSHFTILTINPGSTSTKIEIWSDQTGKLSLLTEKKIKHTNEELSPFKGQNVTAQIDFRKKLITDFLEEANTPLSNLDFIMGRGGLVPKSRFQSGIVEMSDHLEDDLTNRPFGNHPSNLGGILSKQLAEMVKEKKVKAAIMDPVVVDELDDIFRISGIKGIEHRSIFHCLNHKAMARRCAHDMGKDYQSSNFIVAHLGGGISVGAHHKGRIVDVNDALEGTGPMSPERAGTLGSGALTNLCFSGQYTHDEIKKMIVGEGGLFSHLGTSDSMEIEDKINSGDQEASLVYEAMIIQIAKSILGCSAIFKREVIDAIILTGGLAKSSMMTDKITDYVERIARVKVYPGELEGEALAAGAYQVLKGIETMRSY